MYDIPVRQAIPSDTLLCLEQHATGYSNHRFTLPKGSYCELFGGTFLPQTYSSQWDFFKLPS